MLIKGERKMEFNIINQNSTCCNTSTGCCDSKYPVAVIGAGPIGLAAASHLKKREIPFIVLESGELANNVRSWQHVTLFSPWKYNVDETAKELLQASGWTMPEEEKIPSGKELLEDYLVPLANLFKEKIYTNQRVIAITREETDRMKSTNRINKPFLVYVETKQGLKTYKASAILDATGTWGNPNPAVSSGVFLPAEKGLKEKIDYHIPNVADNKSLYAGKKVGVIGGGHSAINSLLQLVKLKESFPATEITWILRKTKVEDALGGGANDELAARGELGMRMNEFLQNGFVQVVTPFFIQSVTSTDDGIFLKGKNATKLGAFDRLIVNTGNRPKFDMHQELRYEVEAITEAVPALAPLIDPNLHSCGTVEAHGEKELRQPEHNFYIVGSKSYGRAPTFLMATGYEQVRSVVSYLAGDIEAATTVKLSLPETGVCNSGLGGCC